MSNGATAVFLPHYGEWGWFVSNHIRRVHYHPAERKIVCCEPGQEVFFPTATEFFHDWSNPIPDAGRADERHYRNPERRRLVEHLQREHPGAELVSHVPGKKLDRRPPFPLPLRRRRWLDCDVVVAPRNRERGPDRNWPHWQMLVDALRSRGLTIGLVGARVSSRQLDGVDARSWDYPDSDALVEMISRCRLFVGTNSGNTHLAAFLNAPIVEFDAGNGPHMVDFMRSQATRFFRKLPHDAWTTPTLVVESVMKCLEERRTDETREVVDGGRGGRRVFGIGLSKTGTKSLHVAFRLLGLESRHYFFDMDRVDVLDAAADLPVARSFRMLDSRYPGSKFVLTVRETESWLRSCRRHFRRAPRGREAVRQLRLDMFGCARFDEHSFRTAKARHEELVRRHFEGREHQLLVLDVCGGEGWGKLCPFLGRPEPSSPFPHANVTNPVPARVAVPRDEGRRAVGEAQPRVRVVLVNGSNPANVARVVRAFRGQSVPCRLMLCENAPSAEFELDPATLADADDVLRWSTNLGQPSRLVPPLARVDCEYTLFQDDDRLPGRDVLAHLLEHADSLGTFSTLGQRGHRCRLRPPRVRRARVRRGPGPTSVDLTAGAHFVRTEFIHHAIAFRGDLVGAFGADVPVQEEGLLLCLGIQRATGFPSLLSPAGESRETLVTKRQLPSRDTRHARALRRDSRARLVGMALKIGWKPVVGTSSECTDEIQQIPGHRTRREKTVPQPD